MFNNQAIKELKESLIKNFHDVIDKMILFGSRVNGDARMYSDYDILIILNKAYNQQFEDKIYDTAYEIDLKHDIFVDIKLISINDLQTLKGKQPFILDALKKGILLYDINQ